MEIEPSKKIPVEIFLGGDYKVKNKSMKVIYCFIVIDYCQVVKYMYVSI